jgi:hypothetical protein
VRLGGVEVEHLGVEHQSSQGLGVVGGYLGGGLGSVVHLG